MADAALPADEFSSLWSEFARSCIASLADVSARSDDRSIADAREVIEQELFGQILAACLLKSRLNELIPIARLPAEILCHIFSCCAYAEPVHRGSDLYCPSPEKRLGWMKVTHVCRSWREVALDSSALWETVPFVLGARWTEELLSRSRPVPITAIIYRSSKSWTLPLSNHLSHIKVLDVDNQCEDHDAGFLFLPAPVLEEFRWERGLDRGRGGQPQSVLSGDTLPYLFAAHAPVLAHILLINCSEFKWAWPSLNSLVHLEIRNRDSNATAVRTVSQRDLSLALKGMPHLESLILYHSLPRPTEPTPGDNPVELPNLSHLSLTASVARCLSLIRHISVPNGVKRIHIKCYNIDPDNHTVSSVERSRLLPQLIDHVKLFRNPKISDLHTALIESGGTYDVRLMAWTFFAPDAHPVLPIDDQLPDIDIYFLCYPSLGNDAGIPNVPSIVLQTLPLHSLRVLSITDLSTWTENTWLLHFGLSIHVEHLLIEVSLLPSLVKALSKPLPPPAAEEPDTEQSEQVEVQLFPQLRSVEVGPREESESPGDVGLDLAAVSGDEGDTVSTLRGLADRRLDVVRLPLFSNRRTREQRMCHNLGSGPEMESLWRLPTAIQRWRRVVQ
ncbi:hypothetical protein BV25DRAFT_1824230 [Artomyces pyxidatus]|uniref:Uncharacterized protein n=1 Tax=Artomyces pyxidatus TaxID=48021 RepID=A0ACB8T4K2_9AGAM|nr:hypothetical protein BV25DRAFT_1824230 [Artomyces pyxidatus]